MIPGRNVVEIYKIIKELIPDHEVDLKRDLEEYIYSLWNIAPENLYTGYSWTPFINILNYHIVEIMESWQEEIQQIISDRK